MTLSVDRGLHDLREGSASNDGRPDDFDPLLELVGDAASS